MQSASSSDKQPQEIFAEESKSKYFQLGIDFSTQGHLAIAMSILFALQNEVSHSFNAIDRHPHIPTAALTN